MTKLDSTFRYTQNQSSEIIRTSRRTLATNQRCNQTINPNTGERLYMAFTQPQLSGASSPWSSPVFDYNAGPEVDSFMEDLGFSKGLSIDDEDATSFNFRPMSGSEKMLAACNRFLLSKAYLHVCLLIIVVSTLTLLYSTAVLQPEFHVFWVLEFAIVTFMVFEVFVRIASLGFRVFLRYWTNRVDIFFTVVCTLALFTYTHGVLTRDNDEALLEEEIGLLLMIARTGIQALRVYSLFKRQTVTSQKIDLVRVVDSSSRNQSQKTSPNLRASTCRSPLVSERYPGV